MVQLGLLQNAHSEVMAEARQSAAEHAVEPVEGDETPDYTGSREDGPDEVNYSADDEAPAGNTGDVQTKLVNYALPAELRTRIGDNTVTAVSGDASLVMDGFVNGHASRTVTLLPVIENLLTGTDSIEVQSDVWMVSIGEIE
jgi:hypothetical protein